MIRWLSWGALLLAVNIAGTLTSRARNTPSLWYHGIAAAFNHACWFGQTVIFVSVAVDLRGQSGWELLKAFGWFAGWSTVGSIFAHWLSFTYIEKKLVKVNPPSREIKP